METVGQRVRIVWTHEQPTPRALDDLREAAAARLDDGHTAGHRFEQEHPFGLVVGRWYGQHVETSEERQLAVPIELAVVMKLLAKSRLVQPTPDFVEIGLVGAAEISRRLESDEPSLGLPPQADVRVREQVKPFLRRDTGEIADREGALGFGLLALGFGIRAL